MSTSPPASPASVIGHTPGLRRVGDVQRYLPWMLEGETPDVTAMVLGQLPTPLQQAYRDEWQPAYAKRSGPSCLGVAALARRTLLHRCGANRPGHAPARDLAWSYRL
jgi:hypothetical protein